MRPALAAYLGASYGDWLRACQTQTQRASPVRQPDAMFKFGQQPSDASGSAKSPRNSSSAAKSGRKSSSTAANQIAAFGSSAETAASADSSDEPFDIARHPATDTKFLRTDLAQLDCTKSVATMASTLRATRWVLTAYSQQLC